MKPLTVIFLIVEALLLRVLWGALQGVAVPSLSVPTLPVAKTKAACPTTPSSPLGIVVGGDMQVDVVEVCGAGARAGLNGGDVVLSVNGKRVSGAKALAGQAVATLEVKRLNGQHETVTVETGGAKMLPTKLCFAHISAFVTLYSGYEIGSGSVIAPNLIVTNHHVVKESIGKSEAVNVKPFGASSPIKGTVAAFDQKRDIALVRASLGDMQPMPIATAPSKPGDPVCAIGSPRALVAVTSGTLEEARGQDLKAKIALRPGNSGGPLLNAAGEQIGVNKSIWLSESGKPTNDSFATPIDEAVELAKRSGVWKE